MKKKEKKYKYMKSPACFCDHVWAFPVCCRNEGSRFCVRVLLSGSLPSSSFHVWSSQLQTSHAGRQDVFSGPQVASHPPLSGPQANVTAGICGDESPIVWQWPKQAEAILSKAIHKRLLSKLKQGASENSLKSFYFEVTFLQSA